MCFGGDKTNRLNETNENNNGTLMKIIAYRSYTDVDIEFLDEFHYIKKHQTYSNFIRGQVKNPYDKTACGVGYIVEGNI